MAILGAVLGAVGGVVSSISKANALRSQARVRQVEGEQELLSQKRRLRQELGLAAVRVGGSGLLGGSFSEVFESQAIEDAEFLGRIKQRTDFDVASLKAQSKATLITGLFLAGTDAVISGSQFQQNQAGIAASEQQRVALLRANPNSRVVPGGNIFGSNASKSSFQLRRARTATFF